MKSQTNVKVTDSSLLLYRLIDTKFYKIEFKRDVPVCDVAQYFNMNNETFKKLGAHFSEV